MERDGRQVVRRPMSPGVGRDRARAWLDAGSPDVPARPAATVMLVRDSATGPQVYVQKRVASMEFAPSMIVFPGGGVDRVDHNWSVDSDRLAALAESMGVDAETASPFAHAAVREVAEECGVLLEIDDLVARGHWVTPAFETRRYDTWILAAAMPARQVAAEVSTETDGDGWYVAGELLARKASGEVSMLPPTAWALDGLAGFASVRDFLADRPTIATVRPVAVRDGDDIVLESVLP